MGSMFYALCIIVFCFVLFVMAGAEFVTAVFLRHKSSLLRELCDSNVLSILTKKGIVTTEDEEYISNIPDVEKKCEFFIELLAKQSLSTFSDFCRVIEKECPTFVNEILNDQCLTSSHGVNLLETLKESMVLECNINRDSSPGCRRSLSRGGSSTPLTNSRRCSMSPETIPIPLNHTIELYTEPVVEDDDRGSGAGGSAPAGGGSGAWETHRVAVSRIPGYGFGIAVSGGRDNPHFASGDPSIAVSDVLKAGPAEELLQVNDRIISVNGVSLENVEYATAVGVLRDSGNTVSLVVRRRAPHAPPSPAPPTPLKITLTKASKKEDFGIVLGCKLFIKELSPKARDQLTSAGQSLCEGDVITRINSTPCGDTMSLKEARKIMESCKERLSLVVLREQRPAANNSSGLQEPSYNNNYGAEPLNSYSGQNLYVAPPSRSTLLADERMEAVGGRSRGPLPPSASPPHLDHLHPPRPPPPRPEDYYSSRRQLYEEDPLSQRNKPASEPRLISFQKDGSVGLRLTGGNQVGIFVSAVQPGSPASLQGLTPGDNILKINEMEMKGVTREEAVLFLLSLQEQIDLIVQHSPEEYQAIAAQQKGDSFHIKCHFHYTEPTKGEMSFRSGDVFHVVDTLHNGTVGAWQVFRIGRNNQEVQKGIIPNKARAEELATAQFNATKKELSASSSESRGSFFRRRRSTHRRSKSLGKEHWDDMVFSDSISKFPAYERVVLKHPGFVRPVVLFGPIADLAREKLLRDYPDKFTAPQLDNTMEDGKSKSTSGIIRLSGIRSIMDRGKHALLDITPNAVDRLNYAQFYPVVIFLKADNKHIIKQLRHSMPKSAHKSSKKLLEHCQRMDRVWGHIFTQTIGLNEPTANSWYAKLTELIQRSQAQQLWISETKRSEPLSDDFLFPMSTTNESRLSYASSPESDVEAGGPEGRAPPRMLRASSDPSVATQQDVLDRDEMGGADVAPPPPPYTTGYGDSKYGFSSNGGSGTPLADGAPGPGSMGPQAEGDVGPYSPPRAPLPLSPPQSPQGMYGHVPELPPRIDRGVKPPGGVLLPGPTPGRNPPTLRHHQPNNTRPSAQERLFGTPRGTEAEVGSSGAAGPAAGTGAPGDRTNTAAQGSLDRHRHLNNTYSYDSMSSYDSYGPTGAAPTTLALANSRLGPNAPDDLKVGPRTDSNTYEAKPIGSPQQRHSTGPVPEATSPSTYGGQFGGRSGPNDQYGTRPDQYGSRTEQFPGRMDQFVTNGGRTEQPSARMEQFAGNGSRTELYGAPPGTYGRGGPPSQSRPHHMSSGDYSKYSSNRNSTEYVGGSVGKAGGAGLYKPVPPPKPKHYRPPPAAGSADPPPPAPQHSKSYSVGNGSMEMHAMHGAQPGGAQNGWGGSPGRAPPGGWPHPQQAQHAHSLSYHPHQQSMYGGQPPPQAPPYTGPPPHTRGPPHANSSHVIDLAGSREQRGSAFELYRKPQHNISPALAMMESGGTSPKVNKKLSKKSSFLRSITIDLFRLKSKKVAKHHSVCESDFQDKPKSVELRREKSDVGSALVNPANKTRGLFRSNSSCENTTHLNSILKRQSSFNENRLIPPIKDSIMIPTGNLHLRRQNSMCEIETEPRIKPILRRQNSLLEYNRHGMHDYQFKPFNMIRTIDPLYQRKTEIKHEPFYPGKDVGSFGEPIFQTKDEAVYGAVPKPERTYATRSKVKSASPYASREEVIKKQTQCPYSSRQEVINEQTLHCRSDQAVYSSKQELVHKPYENPNSLRCEMQKENTYESRLDCNQQRSRESPSGIINHSSTESPYASKSEVMRQKSSRQNPYSTKEEMLRQRLGIESPYGTKDSLKERVSWECPYATKGEISKHGPAESPYATKEDVMRYRGIENPYQTKEELLRQRLCSENPYGTKEQFIKKTYSENTCNELDEITHYRDPVESSSPSNVEFRKHRHCSESSHSSRDERNHFRPHSDHITSTREKCTRSQSNSCHGAQQKNVNQSLLDNNYNDSVGSEHSEFSYVNNLATLRIGDNPHVTVVELNKRSSVELHVKPLNDSGVLNHGECSLSNITAASDQGPCVCEDISSRTQRACSPRSSSAESPYVTKQEILSQKAALLASKEIQSLQPEDRFEIIRLRNQVKKEKIYQSRIEAMKDGKSADPIYVSKRDLKESVIYESQSEIKDQLVVKKDADPRHSPYDLSDVAHLSRRESLYQSKQEAMQQNSCFPRHPGVDFEALRNQSQTDQEKQSNLIYETKILKGEPMYQSRLPPKVKFVSQDVKKNKATAFNSATSMETHYESECSMQFDIKPQSTPYASQDMDRGNETIPTFKCNNKSVKFANSSGEGHDTTVVQGPLVLDTDLLAVGQKGKIGGADGPCTTWGIFDSEGGVLEDRSWGVSLLIPPDAILPGVKQKIYFTVSDPTHNQTTPGPPIDMDKGEALLSPLVMCGPQGLGFARPVTLRLPHCANTLPSLGLTLNATDTEPGPSPSWDNILLPATTTLNTVAVKVDHF